MKSLWTNEKISTKEMLMNAKVAVAVVVCVLTGLSISRSFAEIIYLKDGRVIEEKIVERSSYYIITMTGNWPNKYFMDQIEYIEEDQGEDTNDQVHIDLLQYEGIAEDKVKLILNLVDVSGVRAAMKKSIKQTIDQVPEERKEKYRKLLDADGIIERLVPIYSKYYSKVDLINMIHFYQSPTGVKVLKSTPEIMKETVDVSIQYIKEKVMP